MRPSQISGIFVQFAVLSVFFFCAAANSEKVISRPPVKREPLTPQRKAAAAAVLPSLAEDAEAPTDKELEAAISDDFFVKPPVRKTPPPQVARPKPAQSLKNAATALEPPAFTAPAESESLQAPRFETNPQDNSVPDLGAGPTPPPIAPTIAPVEPPLSLAESFSAEKNPGRGTLVYKRVDQNETIDLGGDSGQFGFGLVFRHATLPEEFIREYGKVDVIQFSFGTLPARAQGRVPEFGTMAVFTKVKPKEWMEFPLITGIQRQSNQDFGLILFSSPKAAMQRSDEEKLRDTYFSKSGTIRLMSTGGVKGLDVDAEGKKVSFKVQAMKIEIEASLSTPFNAQKNQLTGAVEIPVYWPESPAALNWMRKFAQRSLLASNSVSTVRGSASEGTVLEKNGKKKKRERLPRGM